MRDYDERGQDEGGGRWDREERDLMRLERRREILFEAQHSLAKERHERKGCQGPDCPHHEGEPEDKAARRMAAVRDGET